MMTSFTNSTGKAAYGTDDDRSSFGSLADVEPEGVEDLMQPLNLFETQSQFSKVQSWQHGSMQLGGLIHDEARRLEVLEKLCILDSPKEEAYDLITRTVAQLVKAPMASISLLDSEREWCKSLVGLEITEIVREMSFCFRLLLPVQPEVLIVPDATLDPRFAQNIFVAGEPCIRFYCGVPIIVEGVRVGSLCVMDTVPKWDMDTQSAFLLANFADLVASLLMKRQHGSSARCDMIDYPTFLVETSGIDLPILYSNDGGKKILDALGCDMPKLSDLITSDHMGSGLAREVPRVQTGVFKGELPCTSYFYPASRQVLGTSRTTAICCPWELTGHRGKTYNFVVVKLERELLPGPAALRKVNRCDVVNLHIVRSIRSVSELEDAAWAVPCVMLFTSSFCSACVHFADFYRTIARMTWAPGLQFYEVNIDESIEILRKHCNGTMPLPMVQFREGDHITRVDTSSWPAFRQQVAAFVEKVVPSGEGHGRFGTCSPVSAAEVTDDTSVKKVALAELPPVWCNGGVCKHLLSQPKHVSLGQGPRALAASRIRAG